MLTMYHVTGIYIVDPFRSATKQYIEIEFQNATRRKINVNKINQSNNSNGIP